MKKYLCLIWSAVFLCLLCTSCGKKTEITGTAKEEIISASSEIAAQSQETETSDLSEVKEDMPSQAQQDIIVLFTNDVHCAIDEYIGYSGLASYKKTISERTPYVTLVDCGDAIQGTYKAAVSKGELPIDLMNFVGYDFAILGNHEFDYGTERLEELIKKANAQYLCCNVTFSGEGPDPISLTKPYEIVNYGGTKVAYIGVTTPESMQSSTPVYFKENDEYVYDFCGESGEKLYRVIQQNVDACLAEGADYIIVLMHMGIGTETAPFTSYEIANNTTGIDVILDAHSHSEIPSRIEQNLEGEDVLIASTGTKLKNIGQMVISPNGFITIGYISDYYKKDSETEAYIAELSVDVDEMMNSVVTTLEFDLKTTDANGIRTVRARETAIGNLIADAYRVATGADIGYINGGSVRADLRAGDITYADIINVCPFGNKICMVEVTGQEILDMLEYFYSNVAEEYVQGGNAYGEFGSFGHFSGLKCTVHTDIPTSIRMEEGDMLAGVGETRRVSDVMVLKNGEFLPLDPVEVYTFATSDYVIKNGGCGMGILMKDHNILLDDIGDDYQILIDYMQTLDGDFSSYREPAGNTGIVK